MKSYLPCFFIVLIFFSCQINGQQQSPEKVLDKVSNRLELLQQFRQKKLMSIVYDADNQEIKANFLSIFKKIEKENERFKIEVIAADELSEQDLKEKVIVLFGTPKSNKWIAQMQSKLPFKITENAVFFDGQEFTDSSVVMKLPLYPNPSNPHLPMQIVTSFNENALLKYLQKFIEKEKQIFSWESWSIWGYEVFKQGQRFIYGHFNNENWEYDKKIHFDFSSSRDSMPSTTHFEFNKQTELNEAQAAIFRKKCEENVEEIRAFLNVQKEIPTIQHCLYRSAEEKGLMMGNTDQCNIDFSENNVHTVLNETYSDNFIGKENELVLRHFLGEPKTLALERGLAIFFTKNWQRKGYQYWAKKLYDSGNMLPLSSILNEEEGSPSRYLNGCLSASFVAFLINDVGKDVFLKNYLTYHFSDTEMAVLEKKWHQFLENQPVNVSQSTPEIPYLKGFNFAHEGYSIYNGYISREAAKALDKMVDLGSNATCIVPYTFMRNSKKASKFPIMNSAGGENDESVVHVAWQSQNRGMTVVLKPQVWVGDGSWPGEIEMATEAEWQMWFNEYYEWILHYAMMAEIHEMEVLCVGTEFVKATLQRPDDWRKLLKKIRKFYTGKLTYAANWGDEFEKITFWEELDYIGLNCYYPLSKNENATDKELKAGFQEVIEKIERVYKKEQKPILFTEIGFPSISFPWLNPHAEPDNPFNEVHQKRCYETVFEAIDKKPWCQGILWWKFPSYLNHRGRENKNFSPNDKVTEEVIRKWF